MKQTSGFISTYSADAFGVCSALFELGGMIVMHDASGCNSTYTTHDEPRWYEKDSMVYISGLTEIEAIMGDDSKLIEDVIGAAEELHPKFIAIVGTTIPAMTGFDADAAARVIEERTGIPSFGFGTTGMRSYVHGAGLAFEILAKNIVTDVLPDEKNDSAVNILGLTPLDFSVNGTDRSIKDFYKNKGFIINSAWAMDSSLDEIGTAGRAGLNIVVSETGMQAALALKERFGTPYKVGVPVCGTDIDVTEEYEKSFSDKITETEDTEILILGERVNSLSLAKYLGKLTGKKVTGYATTDADEDEIKDTILSMKKLEAIIADPLFENILKLMDEEKTGSIRFIPLPHEAFSGRLYRDQIPDIVTNIGAVNDLCK